MWFDLEKYAGRPIAVQWDLIALVCIRKATEESKDIKGVKKEVWYVDIVMAGGASIAVPFQTEVLAREYMDVVKGG